MFQNTRTTVHVSEHLYGSSCFRTPVRQFMFQNTCMAVHVSEHLYGSSCFRTPVWQFVFQNTCTAVRVSEHLYNTLFINILTYIASHIIIKIFKIMLVVFIDAIQNIM
jgi:glucan phosphoethanolaminetransferase (alkaline phosphatase superfamily)